MQTKEDTTLKREHPQMPADAPSASDIEQQTAESAAYSAEEQALVEERLKNLGYL